MEKKDVKYSKYCLVPYCRSTLIKTPEKIFISLPLGSSTKLQKKRKLWLLAMGRNDTDISDNTRGFLCEDHFNLEEDMENYVRFKLMGGKVFLKDHVVPHIFKCQSDRKRHLPPKYSTTKRSKNALVDILMNETPEDEEGEVQFKSQLKSSNITPEFQIEQVLPEDLLSSKSTIEDKGTQTVCIEQRTVSVQCTPHYKSKFVQYRPHYRSKFVQTDVVIVTNFSGDDCPSTNIENSGKCKSS